jgi:hypothetical protein
VAPYGCPRLEVKHGPYRRAVGRAGAPDPYTPSSSGRQRSALARPQRHPKRHPLDLLAHWGTLARPPRTLPSLPESCHRRFQKWVEEGTLSRILDEALAEDLKERGGIDLSECFIDEGTFVVWPKRASLGGKDQAGQVGSKLMAMADGSSVPISVNAASASAHEVTLVGETLSLLSVRRGASFEASRRPGLRLRFRSMRHLEAEGIEMIAPHRRRNTKKAKTLKTLASSDATRGAGRWSDCLLGFLTSGAWGRALRAAGRELPGLCAPWVPHHPVEVFMR